MSTSNAEAAVQPMLHKIGVAKNFARFTGKHHCPGVYNQIHLKVYF